MIPLYKSVTSVLTVSFNLINFNFQIFFFLFLKCLLAPSLTLFCFSSCNHSISACFLWSTNREHSPSNHGLYRFTHTDPLSLSLRSLFENLSNNSPSPICPHHHLGSPELQTYLRSQSDSFTTSSSPSFLRLISWQYSLRLVYLQPVFPVIFATTR
jgi:hypothetical protein